MKECEFECICYNCSNYYCDASMVNDLYYVSCIRKDMTKEYRQDVMDGKIEKCEWFTEMNSKEKEQVIDKIINEEYERSIE